MDNPEEVLHILDEFSKLKPKDIPRELEDYLSYVARTGDPVYQWSLVKCLFREKLVRVITDFYESTALVNPPSPTGDSFNYEGMKRTLVERLETFSNAPFTVQRLCELLTAPRKQYNRTDKFMRAIEKNILVVSTREPGSACRQDNLTEPLSNGMSDGDSLNQNANNDTLHLGTEPHSLIQNQDSIAVESSINEENHVDISSIGTEEPAQCSVGPIIADGTVKEDHEAESPIDGECSVEAETPVEAEGSVIAVDTKNFDPVDEELTGSSDLSIGDKLVSDSAAHLDNTACLTPVDSRLVQQEEILNNVDPNARLQVVDSVEHFESVEHADSTDQTSREDSQCHVQLAGQEGIRLEQEEDASANETDALCESKDVEENVEQLPGDVSESTGKPFIEDSDVSCSTSDNHAWAHTPTGEESIPEPDDVSTTEAVLAEKNSEPVQDSVLAKEEGSTPSSSDDFSERCVQPESSKTPQSSNEECERNDLEAIKNIDSSSDVTVLAQSKIKEDDPVGTTEEAVVQETLVKVAEEVEEQTPHTDKVTPNEPYMAGTTDPVIPGECIISEAPIPELAESETEVTAPVISSEDSTHDAKVENICGTSESSADNEMSKEVAPAVSDEAMDVDEANSCHSTGAIADSEGMTVTDQSEPMDDTE